MNKYIILLLLFAIPSLCFSVADDIIGEWVDENNTGTTIFSKVGDGKYIGTCGWLKKNVDNDGGPAKDRKNPDKSKRSQAIVGSHVMDISYDAKNKRFNMDWAYDPSMGIALDDCGYIKQHGDTLVVKAGWAFIKVTKKLRRVKK